MEIGENKKEKQTSNVCRASLNPNKVDLLNKSKYTNAIYIYFNV